MGGTCLFERNGMVSVICPECWDSFSVSDKRVFKNEAQRVAFYVPAENRQQRANILGQHWGGIPAVPLGLAHEQNLGREFLFSERTAILFATESYY
jgi:hypothetical protein